jgi:hypothetical protein
MIKLGRMRIETEASIVDARSKIGALARSFGFDAATVTRTATLVSEMCRKAHESRRHFHLDIALDQRENQDGLALIFRGCAGPQLSALAGVGFDRVQETPTHDWRSAMRWWNRRAIGSAIFPRPIGCFGLSCLAPLPKN